MLSGVTALPRNFSTPLREIVVMLDAVERDRISSSVSPSASGPSEESGLRSAKYSTARRLASTPCVAFGAAVIFQAPSAPAASTITAAATAAGLRQKGVATSGTRNGVGRPRIVVRMRVDVLVPIDAPSISTKAAADCGRSTGALAIAAKIASSTSSGTMVRTMRTLGTCSMMWRAMIAIALLPVNGGSPASISYSMQPRL